MKADDRDVSAVLLRGSGMTGRRSGWLAIDVDGVLADHVARVLPILKRDFHFAATVDDIRIWDFPIGNSTFGGILRACQKEPDFVMTTPLVPGARDAMSALYASHHIAIVTARPAESDPYTHQWLQLHGIAYDAYANLREGGKHDTAIPCDVLIDDYQLNVLEFLTHSSGRAILFSQPWNWNHTGLEQLIASRRLLPVRGWEEVLRLVPGLL